MKDIVLEGFVKNFAESRGLTHLQSSELFEAFAASVIFRKYHQSDITDIEDGVLVGGGGDGGMDAIAILVNGRPARAEEDVDFFLEVNQGLNVEFIFVQAKSSSSISSSDIGNFTFGVEQFFSAVEKSDSKVEFNSQIQQLVNLTRYIYDQGIHMQDNPKCCLYFVTAGNWADAPDPIGRLTHGVESLREKNIFEEVNAFPVDAEMLKAFYRELVRGVVREVEFDKTAAFPRIAEVAEAYIGLMRGLEFIKLISTTDGQLNRELFFDNVRDFQGHNPVNSEIDHTLTNEQLRRNFPLLNNGVTIVARELNRRGDIFKISDFQIVNGCQTTNVLFQNKDSIDENTFIPVKLVATSHTQVITEVIKATNRQTAVLPEALESLTQFHRELEDFYRIREESRSVSDRIHYERRSKQYARDNISPKNIVSLTAQIKSFIGMFLNEPHSHPRYYGELLRSYERLFSNDHKPAPYYTSGVTLLAVENWLNARPDERELRFYKYQILMLLRMSMGGQKIPHLNSNSITDYSLRIVEVLRDPESGEKAIEEVTGVLKTALAKFGTRRGERNPPHRLRAFTEQLAQTMDSKVPVKSDPEPTVRSTPGGIEQGELIWFDEWKNYGFIERDAGGDIFVHESQISLIPWHLRTPAKRVEYRVVHNPRSRGKLMASAVKLAT